MGLLQGKKKKTYCGSNVFVLFLDLQKGTGFNKVSNKVSQTFQAHVKL